MFLLTPDPPSTIVPGILKNTQIHHLTFFTFWIRVGQHVAKSMETTTKGHSTIPLFCIYDKPIDNFLSAFLENWSEEICSVLGGPAVSGDLSSPAVSSKSLPFPET